MSYSASYTLTWEPIVEFTVSQEPSVTALLEGIKALPEETRTALIEKASLTLRRYVCGPWGLGLDGDRASGFGAEVRVVSASGWIGVDLDGTLASYGGWNGGSIGKPVPLMLERVKRWIAQGIEVRIVTARVAATGEFVDSSQKLDCSHFASEQRTLIEEWCEEHVGQKLKVTAQKDFAMVELWDDRAIGVEINTGRRLDGVSE